MTDGSVAVTGRNEAREMGRFWRLSAVLSALCVALAVTAAGTSAAKPSGGDGTKKQPLKAGQLDPSFGQNGKIAVSVPKSENPGQAKLATAPSGKSYILDGSLLLAFGANAKPDRSFGQNGRVNVAAATGVTTSVAGLTVDGNGRILVIGSFEPTPGAVDHALPIGQQTALTPEQPISKAFVVRYLPNGERDASFGTSGEIDATLEVPIPSGPDPLHYETPTVFASQIAIVEGDKPVIGGLYIYSAQYCYFENVPAFAYTARLDPGAPGTRTLPTSAYTNVPSTNVSALTPTPAGGLAALTNNGSGCPLRGGNLMTAISLLNPDGSLAAMDPNPPELTALNQMLAVDPSNRMLVIEGPVDFSSEHFPWKLVRLLPNGDLDTSYGENGGMPLLGFGEERIGSIATDAKGRALVGGGSSRFRVVRVGTKAKIDHSFGKHGWAEAGFGKGTSAELTATAVDAKGRILAAGRVKDRSLKTGEGVGLVRFLSGN